MSCKHRCWFIFRATMGTTFTLAKLRSVKPFDAQVKTDKHPPARSEGPHPAITRGEGTSTLALFPREIISLRGNFASVNAAIDVTNTTYGASGHWLGTIILFF